MWTIWTCSHLYICGLQLMMTYEVVGAQFHLAATDGGIRQTSATAKNKNMCGSSSHLYIYGLALMMTDEVVAPQFHRRALTNQLLSIFNVELKWQGSVQQNI
jgi:hypothetical protein